MRIICLITSLLFALAGNAQLLTWSPDFIQESSTSVTIKCDATKGNQGLKNYTPTSDVYVHIGVITTASTGAGDWKHVVVSNFNAPNALVQTTYLGNNIWSYTITGGLRTFFGLTDPNEKILKIAILFRNGAGSLKLANTDGSDMYVPVYSSTGLFVRLDAPSRLPTFTPVVDAITKKVGDTITLTAKASQSSTISILLNGTQIAATASATSLTTIPTLSTGGLQTVIAKADNGTSVVYDTSTFFVQGASSVGALPAGVVDGINYEPGDTSAILVLYAPLKKNVYVLGDFNNWTQSAAYQMTQTPDSLRYWIRIKGLTAGKEYAYQYLIDQTLTVADYNTEKILDKNNDPYISAATYPNLMLFPSKATGSIVSILQTAKPAYNWQVPNFTKPNKNNLIIYELLVRDFTAAQNWQTLKDTLTYLKRLGVNAIEVMPFNEFEGNSSWGYNPNFYFAPDKAYGTETALRQFIDACHANGMAVIMDMVMNHSFGTSPMVQMYWDAVNNQPAANSPWFNTIPTHPYNVGYQFNHQSQATKDFVDRVVTHWLTKYKIDGFRWDLAKGFTQKMSCLNAACNTNAEVSAWGQYDSSRVTTWKRIYDKMQSVTPASYCILEMFADNSEETVEANYGMMLWGNMNDNFSQATMGYSTASPSGGTWDITWGISQARGWSQPNLVTYQESHDEERVMYKNEQYGNTSGSYSVKTLATGLKRNEMATAFWAMIPGPKMLWQFGELGYDFSINTCANGTVNSDGSCRTDPKPIHWEYYQNANRFSLYNVYAQLIKLRTTPNYITTFTKGTITYSLTGAFKSMIVSDDSLKVVVIGNFDVIAQTGSVTFPTAGTWYNYLGSNSRQATGAAESITLQPGEYYVYVNKNINNSVPTATTDVNSDSNEMQIAVYPNPVNNNAVVAYNLIESGNISIDVVDLGGKRVGNVFRGFKTKGAQTIQLAGQGFNQTKLSSGLYLLQLEQSGRKKTTKFVVLK